jgi:hypothetical protein
MDQGLPSIGRDTGYQQALYSTAARHAAADQPCREDAGIVDDEDIAWPKEVRKRGHRAIGDSPGHSI